MTKVIFAICSAALALNCQMTNVLADSSLPEQSPNAFMAALRETSTSPQFVAITVINDGTGRRLTGCITANLFLGAIHREFGLRYDDLSNEMAITRISLADESGQAEGFIKRTFHFKQQSAWDNMPSSAWKQEACDIIRGGGVARLSDRTGLVISSKK